MGNCASASNVQVIELEIAPRIRVVHATEARVVDVEVPASEATMSVGELMLEFPPGHFLAELDLSDPSTAVACTGKRASPLGADAEATPGPVYVLFPMPRLHTRITPQELLSLAKLLHLHDAQLPKAAYPSEVPGRPAKPLQVLHRRLFIGRARVAPLAQFQEECTDDNLSSSALSHNDQVISFPLMASCPTPIASVLLQPQNEQESIISSTPFMRSCHGPMQMQMIKSKPWAPKLETIKEGSS